MSNETVAWMAVLFSFLVLVMSAIVLWSVSQSRSANQSVSLPNEVDPLLEKVEAIRKTLGRMSNARGWDQVTPGRRAGAQGNRRASPPATRLAAESVQLAQLIRNFHGEVKKWIELAGNRGGTPRSMEALQPLENKVREDAERTPEVQRRYLEIARDLACELVSATDMNFNDQPGTRAKLDVLLKKICALAGVTLIDPEVGEDLDKQLHKELSEDPAGARLGTAKGKPKISHVFARGLQTSGLQASGKGTGNMVILKAEVEVKY